jgi:mannose-1-phosphate guanylyltransferase/phosphomannomutase
MKAVIMAGGKGTRLRPLTSGTPKPMVPLLDRPVMEYTIELLKKHGITEIAVTLQYLPEVIRQYFGDGSDFGVRLHYFEETSPLGTAGSIKNAEDFLDETFLVISGDALTDFDLTRTIEFHRRKQALGTLVLTRVESPLEFGVVMTDESGKIIRFLEKPGWGEVFSDTVNTGIYILETEIFRYFDAGKEFDFSKDLFPLLMRMNRPLFGYVAEGYWSDIGNLAQYRQTQFDMLDRKVDVAIAATQTSPGIWISGDARVSPGAVVRGPAFIGEGSVLESGSFVGEYSVIGSGAVIGPGASLERAVLWRRNRVEAGAEIKGATLCQHVVSRPGSMAGEDAVIGDGCRIGVNSVVLPGLKVFPGKRVEDHTTLKHSLIWGEGISKQLFGRFGIKGACNVEITPLFAGRVAQAYGSTLKAGTTVGIGHDASPFAALIAQALTSGLHASGIHTYDFGTVTSAVTRHAVYHLDSAGGIHVRMEEKHNGSQLVIEFLDSSGIPISREAERKIENAYMQEDYRLIEPKRAGRRRECPNASMLYCEHLLKQTDAKAKGYTIVMQYDYRTLQHIVPECLEALGCQVVQLNHPSLSPKELARWVRSAGADLGVGLDANGQKIVLVTGEGEIVPDEMVFVLQILIQLHNHKESQLHVPVNVPTIVELLAANFNREVVRTKVDIRSTMEACRNNGFHVYWDGMYTLIHILQLMSEKGLSLAQLIDTIPVFALLKEQVECPWTEKGKVMRYLMEETKGKQVELIDGIKIYEEEGWTLILPDSDEPIFQVFANAESHQVAKMLATTYARKIADYRGGVTV